MSDAPRASRSSRSTGGARPSYNENLLAADFGERDDGDANPSTFPCYEFLQGAVILTDFNTLVNKAGLTTYM